GVIKGAGAEDHAIDAAVQGGADVRFRAESAAELAGNPGRVQDSADGVAVDWMAGLGAVQVHEVQPLCALGDPPPGHVGGVVAEDGFLGVIPLAQAHAAAAADVDRGKDQHSCELPILKPAAGKSLGSSGRHWQLWTGGGAI